METKSVAIDIDFQRNLLSGSQRSIYSKSTDSLFEPTEF